MTSPKATITASGTANGTPSARSARYIRPPTTVMTIAFARRYAPIRSPDLENTCSVLSRRAGATSARTDLSMRSRRRTSSVASACTVSSSNSSCAGPLRKVDQPRPEGAADAVGELRDLLVEVAPVRDSACGFARSRVAAPGCGRCSRARDRRSSPPGRRVAARRTTRSRAARPSASTWIRPTARPSGRPRRWSAAAGRDSAAASTTDTNSMIRMSRSSSSIRTPRYVRMASRAAR